jgi:hypothetical protein
MRFAICNIAAGLARAALGWTARAGIGMVGAARRTARGISISPQEVENTVEDHQGKEPYTNPVSDAKTHTSKPSAVEGWCIIPLVQPPAIG